MARTPVQRSPMSFSSSGYSAEGGTAPITDSSNTTFIQDILRKAMISDLGSGGKNISELNTILNAYTPSASELNRQAKQEAADDAINNSISTVDDILSKWKNMPELEKRLPNAIVRRIPGLAPNRAAITSTFFNSLEPELRQAAIGGRVTQQEIQWIRDALLPGPLDTYESASAKINALRDSLEKKLKNPKYDITKTEVSGKIRVKEKSSGRTGTLDAKEFDPNLYEKL